METDDLVARKTARAVDAGLVPIVCVGERLHEREAGSTFARIDTQVRTGLARLPAQGMARVVVAYEPVWAIGTGRTATPAQAEEVHEFIRKLVASLHGDAVASGLRILYGGSVKPENARALMTQADVDGALVGGASLQADAFAAIVESTR
jgi:triosephosphate isomerase